MTDIELLAERHKHHVVIYGRMSCGFCVRATLWMKQRNIPFEFVVTSGNLPLRDALARHTGQSTVPQIFVGGVSVGGYQELLERASDDAFLERLATGHETSSQVR